MLPLSSSPFEGSVDFVDQPAFVQPILSRRANFLEDEDSEDDEETPSSPASSESSDSDSLYTMPVPTIVKSLHGFFDASIWHYEPSLQLTYPIDSLLSSSDVFPDADILDALETEINGLITYMLDCITTGRFDELTELGSDFHWATSAIARNFPTLSLLEGMDGVVELLLARAVALGTS